MRAILFAAFVGLFAANVSAAVQAKSDLQAEIETLKAKAASGQNISEDIQALSKKVEANAQSLVVTHKVDLSIVDNDGKVSLFVPGKPKATVIAKSSKHEQIAADAIAPHDPDGAISLGGGKKKKDDASSAPTATAAPASTDSSSGGFGDLISSAIGAAVSIGTSVVGGLVQGVVGGIL